MDKDAEMSDSELLQEAMACSVRQRMLLQLAERRAAHRELDARLRRESRERNKAKGASPATEETPRTRLYA